MPSRREDRHDHDHPPAGTRGRSHDHGHHHPHAPHPSRLHKHDGERAHPHARPPSERTGGAHDHAHGHGHSLRHLPEFKLWVAFGLTLAFMFVEIGFGIYARSLTLSSDAGHMFGDAGALLLALIAQRFAARAATPERTYGFRRAEILAAFINGVALLVTASWVVIAAWGRWREPPLVRGEVVTVVGTIGLGINLMSAWILSHGEGHNLNTRAALAHVLTDTLGSVIAIAAGLLSWRLGLHRADTLLSFVMAALIVYGAWLILRRAAVILMEGTPPGLDLALLERTIRNTPGVADLHDLHAWTISEGFDVITVHVVLDGNRHGTEVAREVGERIHAIHRVAHVTVQPEAPRSPELRSPRSLLTRPTRN